jgi:C1A family cysteine protease
MKTPTTLLLLGVATIASTQSHGDLVAARPMHADIDYPRYLLEKEDIVNELKKWMSKWKEVAQKNGWIPAPKLQNATDDDIEEDRKQRFFLAKQLIERLKNQNPLAEFSTDSPFTLLTTEEFSSYVKNSYIAGGGARQLRGEAAPAPAPASASASTTDASNTVAGVRPNVVASTFGDYLKRLMGNANTNGETRANAGSSYSLGDMNFSDWFNNFDWSSIFRPATPAPTVPTTPAPAPMPTTAVPTTTPLTTTPTPITTTVAPQPTTTAPVPTTSRPVPVPTTTRPTTTSKPNPNLPVAPIYSLTDAPATTPAATPKPNVDAARDASSLDWSAGKCMPPIQNQGQCGSCWSFASVAAVEVAQCLAQGADTYTKLSEQNLASCDSNRNKGCDGGVPQYAMQYIQQNGLCTLADDPYTSSSGRLAACNTGCKKVQTGMKGAQPLAQNEAALLKALNTHPVVVAVQAGNDAWKQYKSGVLTACPSTSAQVDHAVVAVGFDATTIKIRNSWGPRWGEAGYVRVARSTTASLGTCKMFQQMVHPTF